MRMLTSQMQIYTRLLVPSSTSLEKDPASQRARRELPIGRDRGGQREMKSCAAPGSASGPQAAAMRLND
jgi:hypothetical protein